MLCTADEFRRLQYSVYGRCVQKAAVQCVWQVCSEGCNMLCTADVFRRLQYVMYSRCVQKAAICCV
jgi:alkylhydroperoxidase family enzyme